MRRILGVGALVVALCAMALVPAGLATASPASRVVLGMKGITCVLGPGADCRDIVHKGSARYRGDLTGATFARAKLPRVDFRRATLDRANLRGAILRQARLDRASLRGADLRPVAPRVSARTFADLLACGSTCITTDLTDASLVGADLTGADLTGADLSGADLSRATLTNAQFPYATLSGVAYLAVDAALANFSNADLTDADFTGADLTDADFTGAQWSGRPRRREWRRGIGHW